MFRNQEKNKDNWHHRIHTEIKVEMGRTYNKNEGQQVDQTLQSGNQGEGRDHEDDQAENGKTT